jgi:hypothetical protein
MPQLTAVVHDAHGVRFVAEAHCARELESRVVDYIRARCDYVLWPRAAANVRELIQRDRKYAAITAYFANVGQRWDSEWLELYGGCGMGDDNCCCRSGTSAIDGRNDTDAEHLLFIRA